MPIDVEWVVQPESLKVTDLLSHLRFQRSWHLLSDLGVTLLIRPGKRVVLATSGNQNTEHLIMLSELSILLLT